MASGTIIRNISNAFRFRLHWESTANQSTNSSTVVAKLYYESTASWGTMGYTDGRAATILINGNASNFTYTRAISANQSKLIGTKTYTVQHNSNGQATIPVGFSVNFGTTWAGTYYGTITASENAVLETIQRNSTLNGSVPSWYLTQEEPIITVSRPNSTYRHRMRVELYYSGVPTAQILFTDYFDTSYKITHDDIVNQNTLNLLARNQQYYSQNVKITLYTYDSSNRLLGSNEYLGGLLSSPGPKVSLDKTSVNLGDSIELDISVGGDESGKRWYANVGVETQAGRTIASSQGLLGLDGKMTVNFDSDYYREYMGQTLVFQVDVRQDNAGSNLRNGVKIPFKLQTGRPPLFSGNGASIQYRDVNTSTTNITGNDQILVRGKSTMRVDLTTAPRATGQDGANIERYILSAGSQTYSYAASSVPSYVNHPITSGAGSSFTWTAVDNRGQESSITKVVDIRDYFVPVINTQTARRTSPNTKVELRVSGMMASVAGTNRIASIKWGLSSTNLVNNMTVSFSGDMSGSYSGIATATVPEDATQAFYFQATDSFGEKSAIKTVSISGIEPLMFIDKDKKAVAIGMYPSGNNLKFEVNGNAKLNGDIFVKESLNFSTSSITDGGNYVQFRTGQSRYYFDKEVNMEGGLVVSSNRATVLNGSLSVSGNSVLGSLTATSFDSSGKVNVAYNTDNGQLEIASNATNYSTGLRLKRGSANTATIEQHYSGYLNFEYDGSNYLRFGGSGLSGNTMNVNSEFLQRTHGKHTILAMSNNEVWLQTSTTTMRVHGSNPGVYVRNYNDSGYNAVYASDFVKSSKRELKKNIEDVGLGSFKDDVLSTPLHRYHYLDDLDEERLRLGFMLDEVPVDNIDLRGEGLDVAAQVATLWGALQEVILELDDVKARLLEYEG